MGCGVCVVNKSLVYMKVWQGLVYRFCGWMGVCWYGRYGWWLVLSNIALKVGLGSVRSTWVSLPRFDYITDIDWHSKSHTAREVDVPQNQKYFCVCATDRC